MAEQAASLHPQRRAVSCPFCGAACQGQVEVCWICRQKLSQDEKIIPAQVAGPPPKFVPQTFSFSLASVFAVMTFVAVGLGLARIDPGLAFLFGFICFPALVITLVRTRAEQRVKGRHVGWYERILTFVLSSAVVFGTLVLGLIALAVALFVLCALIIYTANWAYTS